MLNQLIKNSLSMWIKSLEPLFNRLVHKPCATVPIFPRETFSVSRVVIFD